MPKDYHVPHAGAPENRISNTAADFAVALMERAAELQKAGLSHWVALDRAYREYLIAHWPPAWGDDLKVLIFGDFDAPDHDLDCPSLGITVEAAD
jgi:hypothetical protein